MLHLQYGKYWCKCVTLAFVCEHTVYMVGRECEMCHPCSYQPTFLEIFRTAHTFVTDHEPTGLAYLIIASNFKCIVRSSEHVDSATNHQCTEQA